jgi:hypothetical protein
VIVGAEPRGVGPIDGEPVQHGEQVIAAAPSKFGRQPRGPVGSAHLQAVAEDGADQLGRYGVEHGVADGSQVRLGRGRGVVVQNRTLRSGRSALDVLAGQAGVAEKHDPGPAPGVDPDPTVNDGQPLVRSRLLLEGSGTEVRSDQLVAWPR